MRNQGGAAMIMEDMESFQIAPVNMRSQEDPAVKAERDDLALRQVNMCILLASALIEDMTEFFADLRLGW